MGFLDLAVRSESNLNSVFSNDRALSEDSGPDSTGDLVTEPARTSGSTPPSPPAPERLSPAEMMLGGTQNSCMLLLPLIPPTASDNRLSIKSTVYGNRDSSLIVFYHLFL